MMARAGDTHDPPSDSEPASARTRLAAVRTRYPWLTPVALVLSVLVATLLIWGPEMEFPTTVSQSEQPAGEGRTVTLDRTVREVSGDAIDDAVSWLTEEGDWLFANVSDGITYALIYIEDALKWTPLAGRRGRTGAPGLRGGALEPAGLHGARFDLHRSQGPLAERHRHHRADRGGGGRGAGHRPAARRARRPQPHCRQPHAPHPRRHADDAQLRLSAARHPLLRPGQAGRHLRDRHLRGAPRHPPQRISGSARSPPRSSRPRRRSGRRPARC